MKNSLFLLFVLTFSFAQSSFSQTERADDEIVQITETLMKYIDGTANGNPDMVREAFHPDFNLYSTTEEDSLKIWIGEDYINGIKVGKKNSREGKILSIDYVNNCATAKVEITIPEWRVFTDYMLLVKYEGSWKIVHKSYTWRTIDN